MVAYSYTENIKKIRERAQLEGGYWQKEKGKRNIKVKETRNRKMQYERDGKENKYMRKGTGERRIVSKRNGKEENTIKKRPERGKY